MATLHSYRQVPASGALVNRSVVNYGKWMYAHDMLHHLQLSFLPWSVCLRLRPHARAYCTIRVTDKSRYATIVTRPYASS